MRRFCILLTALLTAGCPAKKPAAPEAKPSPTPAETPEASASPADKITVKYFEGGSRTNELSFDWVTNVLTASTNAPAVRPAGDSPVPSATPTAAESPKEGGFEIIQRKEILYPADGSAPITTISSPLTAPESAASPAPTATPEATASPIPTSTPEASPSPTPPVSEQGKDAPLEGTWSTTDVDGEVFSLTLSRNGVAATDWVKGTSGAKGQHGQWQKTNDTLVSIKYDDGTADAMMWLDGKWNLKRHPRAGAHFDPLAKPVPMQKVDPAKAKFIGAWKMNQEPDGSYLTITLYADGRAVSTVNGKTVGTWTVKGNAAICTWPDNWFDSIEPKDKGWQRRSWVGAEANGEADSSEAVRVGAAP